MTELFSAMDEDAGEAEALRIFEKEIGATGVRAKRSIAGNKQFLKFIVGREAPVYEHALRETKRSLSSPNPFRGTLGLIFEESGRFPKSLEAGGLQTLLTRSTRAVAENSSETAFSVPYVPFQNREDHLLAQPASHVIVGRRGVGKSTLIKRAAEIIRDSASLIAILDVQTYSLLNGDNLIREMLYDIVDALISDTERVSKVLGRFIDTAKLRSIANDLTGQAVSVASVPPRIKRALSEITQITRSHVFVFLDDFHLLNFDEQPRILHLIHASLKGANAWIKVAGLRSLLNYYSARDRIGLQVPGDAQLVPLDLTLENPEQAEGHLRAILENFLNAVGYSITNAVLPNAAFRRLAWANAGVPRDFLQMFNRALDHARRNHHSAVTLSDVNAAIGEFGQRKMDELAQDARNSQGELIELLESLETFCLEKKSTNGFLVRSENSKVRELVHVLSDLRLVHLINQSITPDRAGERYEAYIIDYSLFTGFRRRPGVKEMVPDEAQFKASQLRRLPKISEESLDHSA
jgi:hypothetical protein